MRTSRCLSFVGIIALGLGVPAVLGVGCSSSSTPPPSDDSGTTPDTGGGGTDSSLQDSPSILPPDTGSSQDSGTEDTGTPITEDSSMPEDTGSPVDAGPEDTGSPADASGGTDTGSPDAGTPDAGSPDSGTPDAGEDASSTGPEDASSDAGATDAAAMSFANPVQINTSIFFNIDSVVTTATGGASITPLDGTGGGADSAFITQSAVNALDAGANVGLPDNAYFPSTGANIPNVQLSWTNAANVNNTILFSSSTNATASFPVPTAMYDQLQIYVAVVNGGTNLQVALNYSDLTSTTSTISVPDWCQGPGTGQFQLIAVPRLNIATNTLNVTCGIVAINLNPNSAKSLISVSLTDQGSGNEATAFYGATGW